jgi:hypothetical protein
MPAAEAGRAAEEAKWVQTLGRLRNERPEAFAAFIERVETERRRRVAQFPKLTDTAKAKLAAEFDTPAKRWEIFQSWLPEYQANNTGSAAAPGPEGAAPEQGEQGQDGTEDRADVAARIAASLKVSPGE